MARPGSQQPTGAELEILRVLWRHPAGQTVRQIHQHLEPSRGSGYTSVLKIVQIMTKKGLLRRDGVARPQVYQANVTEHETQRKFMRDLFERVFGGSAKELLQHALALQRTKPEELDEIRRMIDDMSTRKE